MYRATTESLFDVNGFASFLGSFFGGMFVGTVALGGFSTDRFGRRSVFTFAMFAYSIATLVAAFQNDPLAMDFWRFWAGVGIGVQLITVDTYISELTPYRTRGKYMAFSILVILTSVPTVAVLSWLLVPHHVLGLDGWRWVMIVGSAGGVLIWFVRRGLPESPRWLESKGRRSRGRTQSSRRWSAMWSLKRVNPLPATAPLHATDQEAQREGRGSFGEMWKRPYLSRTVMLSVFNFCQTFGVYGFGSWVPVLLYSKGITLTHSLLYTMVIACATPLGAVGAIACAERFQRKWQLVGCALVVAVFGVLFGFVREPALILVCGSAVTIANNWLIGIFHTYQAELLRPRIIASPSRWFRVQLEPPQFDLRRLLGGRAAEALRRAGRIRTDFFGHVCHRRYGRGLRASHQRHSS